MSGPGSFKNRLAFFTLCTFASGVLTAPADARAHCQGSPKITGQCFAVRGRLGVYNGIPLRIWIVGTHRMLSVRSADTDDEEDGLPTPALNLLKQGAPGEFVVFGDYKVCPLAKKHAGWMRPVCVESASRLQAVKTPSR